MKILTQIFWWTAILLEVLIVFRAVRNKFLRAYPLFYTYIVSVLAVDVLFFMLYQFAPLLYNPSYWPAQFATLLIGYGVILEILHKTIGPYAGAERFARIIILGIFAAIFLFVMYRSMTVLNWSAAKTYAELERDLRAVQALVLASILGVIFYYAIAIGANLKGMAIGYGLFIATSIANLALRSYRHASFYDTWLIIQPLSYLVSLAVWTVALWRYQPNPVPAPQARIESDYLDLVSKTRKMLGSIRSHLGGSGRP